MTFTPFLVPCIGLTEEVGIVAQPVGSCVLFLLVQRNSAIKTTCSYFWSEAWTGLPRYYSQSAQVLFTCRGNFELAGRPLVSSHLLASGAVEQCG